jgi:molybdopterin molybdotransferase
VGARDHVAEAIAASGKPGILQHGIAVKPGKPTLIGQIGDCLVLGLPGHPAAAWFMALQLLQPLLACLQGKPEPEACVQTARLLRRIPSNHGREELVPVRLTYSADTGIPATATPVFGKSGLIALLRECQGYIRIPRDCEGLDAGSTVSVTLLEQQSLREGDKRCLI